ncbi:Uncharacterised protein [uncultured archaeon]|nr:Uncharacterised protein [uncultured archaeon]
MEKTIDKKIDGTSALAEERFFAETQMPIQEYINLAKAKLLKFEEDYKNYQLRGKQ